MSSVRVSPSNLIGITVHLLPLQAEITNNQAVDDIYIVIPVIAAFRSNLLLKDVAKFPQANYNDSKKQSKQLSY